MNSQSPCPFCHLTVPSSELERHANSHFVDEDDWERQEQLAMDLELARQIALSPSSSMSPFQRQRVSPRGEQTASSIQIEGGSTSNSYRYSSECADEDKGDMGCIIEDQIKDQILCLIDLQMRSTFHKIEIGLMTLLSDCLELEKGDFMSILCGYVDHFQSIPSEDEGWGCGWRNIQMLCSHLLSQRQEAREVLFGGSGFVPDIASLQRWLEIAWERGFDRSGSNHFNQTIYGSEKWIGTTECAALLRSFGLRTRVVDFGPTENESLYLSVPGSSYGKRRKSKAVHVHGPLDKYLTCNVSGAISSGHASSSSSAHTENLANDYAKKFDGSHVLIDFVWNYFYDETCTKLGQNHVVVTEKAPLYFQQDGHSRTIVGIQVKHSREKAPHYNLLILDPGHRTNDLEKSLKEKSGWQKLIKRGVHTLKATQYQLCHVDHGIASAPEMLQLKTIESVFFKL